MFAMRVGDFMNTRDSLSSECLASFENAKEFHMEEAWYPPGGFETFNQLFCRYLIKGVRPIAGDNKVIVFPADSTFECQQAVDDDSIVTIKTLPWPISALLRGSAYESSFAGGTWMHAFLGPTDYHRQHAPVSGSVLEAKVIQGLCYLEVDVVSDPGSGKKTLQPHRGLLAPRRGWLKDDDDVSADIDAPDTPGYQFIQTRGCIIIDSPVVGLVAVLPIGMAYVSSVNLSVQSRFNTNGTLPSYVNKGDEISNFQFGGSDIVVVFQKQPGVTITAEQGKHYRYGEQLATRNELPRP